MTHASWPICRDCEGFGSRLLNAVTHQRDAAPCDTCQGTGRIKPDTWRDPVWEPPGDDGSPGRLIDPGSDPELQRR